jgi:hypothetical protein
MPKRRSSSADRDLARGRPSRPPQWAAYARACLALKAAALTRFWQALEQNRLVPFREVST